MIAADLAMRSERILDELRDVDDQFPSVSLGALYDERTGRSEVVPAEIVAEMMEGR